MFQGGTVVMRTITGAEQRDGHTVLHLSCGHERSIGGHVLPSGERITHVSRMLGREYDCRDGMCGRRA